MRLQKRGLKIHASPSGSAVYVPILDLSSPLQAYAEKHELKSCFHEKYNRWMMDNGFADTAAVAARCRVGSFSLAFIYSICALQ